MLKLITLLFFVLVSACAYQTAPIENREFVSLQELSELNGVFSNKGDPDGYLSGILWGQDSESFDVSLGHKNIEYVQVATTENSIVVRAIHNNCVIHSEAFRLSNYPLLSDGKIGLPGKFSLFSEVHVGPSYQSQTMGLDSDGDGKYRSKQYLAGLAFWILPFALSETKEITFKKIMTSRVYDEC